MTNKNLNLKYFTERSVILLRSGFKYFNLGTNANKKKLLNAMKKCIRVKK